MCHFRKNSLKCTNFIQLFPFFGLGLLKNSTQNQLDPEILQETIGERIISRSRLCQYAVIRNTNLPNNHQICNECKIVFPSNENHEVKEEIIISDDEGT